MAASDSFGFGKFVPGFDFMQALTKQATQTIPQLPNMANWIAPTLNVEELDKRLEELKQVQFWLNQNANALSAVIQALEVQKMTLATLKDMNFNLGDVANAFKLKAADTVMGGVSKAVGAAAGAANAAKAATKGENPLKAAKEGAEAAASLVPDAMQWWGGLSKQFAQIAGQAMQQAGQKTALDAAINTATELGKGGLKAGMAMADSLKKPSKIIASKRIDNGTVAKKAVKKTTATAKKATTKPRSAFGAAKVGAAKSTAAKVRKD